MNNIPSEITDEFSNGWKKDLLGELLAFQSSSGADAEKEIRAMKTPFDVYFRHAEYVCKDDRRESSIRSLNECLRLRPRSKIANCALARIYMTSGQFEKAESLLRKAIGFGLADFKSKMMWLYLLEQCKSADPVLPDLKDHITDSLKLTADKLGCEITSRRIGDFLQGEIFESSHTEAMAASFQKNKVLVINQLFPIDFFSLLLAQQRAAVFAGGLLYQKRLNRLVSTDILSVGVLANYVASKIVSKIVGKSVVPTYSFSIHYQGGGFIQPHVDRKQNELSMSVNLDISPDSIVWPLYSDDKNGVNEHHLSSNDAFLYRGAEITHYRKPLPVDATCNQIILGFCTADEGHCYCS